MLLWASYIYHSAQLELRAIYNIIVLPSIPDISNSDILNYYLYRTVVKFP